MAAKRMATQTVTYPFEPKSTRFSVAGQFWPIRLCNGRYCCGRVIRLFLDVPEWRNRGFLAGLMDWTDAEPPTSEALAGHKACAQGLAHSRTIRVTGPMITGIRDLALDKIEPASFIRFFGRGAVCVLTDGYRPIRLATCEERERLSDMQGWGYSVIKRLAEKQYGNKTA